MKGEPLSLVVAAGPYTVNENLLFEAFETLVDKVLEDRPDVFILVSGVTCCNATRSVNCY